MAESLSPYRSDEELMDDLIFIETGDPYAPLPSERKARR